MAGLVIDASVAVKWFLDEDRAREALAFRHSREDLIAPSSLLLEVFHALWVASRAGRFQTEQLREAAGTIRTPFAALVPVEHLIESAGRLTLAVGHPIYDCIYLALGVLVQAEVITADQRMFRAAQRARIPARLL